MLERDKEVRLSQEQSSAVAHLSTPCHRFLPPSAMATTLLLVLQYFILGMINKFISWTRRATPFCRQLFPSTTRGSLLFR